MLVYGSHYKNTPVMSLQTGTEIARLGDAVIDPRRLVVLAYKLSGRTLGNSSLLLRIEDIREVRDIGFIIDSSEELILPSDVIQINQVYNSRFNLVGIKVIDVDNKKIGKVEDYVLDNAFNVLQLSVHRPFLKSLMDDSLLINRDNVVDISDDAIVIESEEEIRKKPIPLNNQYYNPFRKEAGPQIDHTNADQD